MEVSPNVLTYKGNFTEPSTEYLHLTNSSSQPLAFKVKTTAPKLYCVRPNASIIGPNESIKISLILQGFTQPLPKDYKCKDKFLIVSLPCPDLADPAKVSEQWSALESKYADQLLQKKLRVNFVIDDDETNESQANETTFANATSSAGFGGAGAAAASGFSSNANDTANRTIDGNGAAAADTTKEAFPSVGGGAAAADDAQQKELEASNQKINNLSDKLDSNEKSAAGTGTSTGTATEDTVSGVSLPFAAVLVLIAVLLGWYIL
ncbi:uncharacterized protein CXQ87_000363 [Candidozyma duobushaemuli]|uniref:MSP domain-containing protein n=2 Tax=Candidozyma TaxID=3303203 RepID=A0ABX8HZK2_9ASCO|nr:uncharacterized protein CXQ87_000363 [[Candida] duobushaemulonis]PVH17477.1 hypothetical protein CXQ87_000363 [[Candida] duobushaemulonis]QWU86114.1 hypothetical protein CA3LBN_000332 [[Candida] haemuloni]